MSAVQTERASPAQGHAAAPSRDAAATSPARGRLARTEGFDAQAAMLAPEPQRSAPGVAKGASAGASAVQAKAAESPGDVVSQASGGKAELQEVSLGFTIPGGRTLSSGYTHTLTTGHGTRLDARVSSERLYVALSPSLQVDATFPAKNASVDSISWNFVRGEPDVHVRSTGHGVVDVSGYISDRVLGLMRSTLGASPLGRPGYNPLRDSNLVGHLGALRQVFESLPATPGADTSPIAARDPSVGATIRMTSPFQQGSGDASVSIPSGGRFRASVETSGDAIAAATAGAARGAAGVASAIRVSALTLEGDNITISQGGEPVAKLKRLQVLPGGQVRVLEYESLSLGAAFADLFQGVSSIVSGRTGESASIVRTRLEEGLSGAVRALVLENRCAIPGVDLGGLLGVR
jgi:hypothetical protein